MTDEPLHATVSLRGVVFGPRDEVLVVRRASDGGWELPGGRLGAREDTEDGVRREIAEETGLDVPVGRPVHVVSWRNDDDRGRVGVYYRCESEERTVSLSDEHTDHQWLSPPAAADRLSEVQGTAVDRAVDVREWRSDGGVGDGSGNGRDDEGGAGTEAEADGEGGVSG